MPAIVAGRTTATGTTATGTTATRITTARITTGRIVGAGQSTAGRTATSGRTAAIMLVLAFFALSVLPVNIAGLLLLALAAGLFVAEIFAPGIGVFAGGGAIALLFAGLFLFERQMRVDPRVLWPTVVVIGIGVVIAGRLAWRARSAQPASGREAFTGRETVLRDASGSTGRAMFEGAWWSVRSRGEGLRTGQRVRVVGMDGLTLLVEPTEGTEPDQTERDTS